MKTEISTAVISFEIPESFLLSLNQSREEFTAFVRLHTALELFNSHKISLGKAAELSGLSKDLFKLELFRNDLPLIDYMPDELEKELEILSQC